MSLCELASGGRRSGEVLRCFLTGRARRTSSPPVLNKERLTPFHPALLGAAPPLFRQDSRRPFKRGHHPRGRIGSHNGRGWSTLKCAPNWHEAREEGCANAAKGAENLPQAVLKGGGTPRTVAWFQTGSAQPDIVLRPTSERRHSLIPNGVRTTRHPAPPHDRARTNQLR